MRTVFTRANPWQQWSADFGDAYLLHSRGSSIFPSFSDGIELALSARSDKFNYNDQTALQARATTPKGCASI